MGWHCAVVGAQTQTLTPTPLLDNLGPEGGGGWLGSWAPQHSFLELPPCHTDVWGFLEKRLPPEGDLVPAARYAGLDGGGQGSKIFSE